jgi:hypothetical protein
MWRRSSSSVPVTHGGSWRCQTSAWPRTRWSCARAKSTTVSPATNEKAPGWGSVDSHFSSFSGVTEANSRPAACA